MSRVNRYGKNEWKRKMLNFLFILFLLAILGGVGGGGYVLLKPKYNAYKQEQVLKRQEKELAKVKEDEKRDTAERAKKDTEEKMKKESEEVDKAQAEKSKKETETETEKIFSDYILPNSDREYLSNSDVKNLTLREINYAKNEIYARHGRKFKSPELQRYFGSKPWYSGSIEPESFSTTVFNDYEQKNAEFLSAVEESISPNGYELDK